jgi:predicted enzyme related to lactoylglutathione lyase
MPVSVIVFVEDVARSLAFYEDVLGAEVDHFDDDGSYGELKAGIGFAAHSHVETHLDLSFHRNEAGGLPGGFELELAVDDVDAVQARAAEAGATVVWDPADEAWGRSALIRDPDGVFVHLTSP